MKKIRVMSCYSTVLCTVTRSMFGMREKMAKKIPITKVKIGDIIGEDIMSANHTMIVPRGTVLTESVMNLLTNNAVFMVAIDDEIASKEEENPSYYENLKSSKEFIEFKEEYENTVEIFSNALNAVVSQNKDSDIDQLVDQTIKMCKVETSGYGLMDFLMNMREYDDSTFCHSMNVALICYVFCDWIGWSKEDQKIATTCGLLHDIGKLKIPDHIVKKPGKLTREEFEVIKQHPVLGYRILEGIGVEPKIRNAALMHHEKCDGTGYPFGILGEKMDKITKMVTIADIYDAMTSKRVYRGPMSPFAVVSAFEQDGLQKYDPELILCFLQNVANTFLNNKVVLSNGNEGKVIFINKAQLSRPTILCGNEFVDLSTNPDISIEKMQ